MEKFTLKLKNKTVIADLEYRQRKTLSIDINDECKIKIKAPLNLEKEYIINFLIKKENWIIKNIDKIQERNNNKINYTYSNRDIILYLGKQYFLKVIYNSQYKKPSVENIGEEIIILCKNEDDIERILKAWYRKKALENIISRVNYFSHNFNKNVRSIKVREQRRRWGSCSYNNDLIFNWRLIMAPQEVIDYVVVHEMCHINHKNHSKNFWGNVKEIMPNYKVSELWLKENGYKIIN